MSDNSKKEFPENGLEEDVCGYRGFYTYLRNNRGITRYTKRKMNKRFRKKNKNIDINDD